MKTICEYLDEDLKKWGDLPYIHEKENREFVGRSFSEVISDVHSIADSLISMGMGGKNIMLFSPNSYRWTVISLAVMGYVGTLVPIDKEWTAYDIENSLSSIDISAIFYDTSHENVISEIRENHPEIKFLPIDEFQISEKITSVPDGINDINARAMILFTSGTTDIPKAIPLTQANLFNNQPTLHKRTPMSTADKTYIFLPLNHVYAGVANFLYTIVTGMQVYLCSDITLIVEEMLEIRPTIVCTVPLILKRLYSAMNDDILEMLRNVRFLYCGGSFTEPELKKYFLENGINLLEAYGTTETSSVIALGLPFDEKIGSAGVVFENLDVRIIDKDENGVGEIIVGGGSVSAGYISKNGGNSEFDANGFYHTGDIGYIDDTGHLYIKGRKKRLIITANGKNVYADEIEELFMRYSEVKRVSVYEENNRISAKIYTASTESRAEEIIEEVNKKLPKFKQIRNFYIKKDTLGGRIK